MSTGIPQQFEHVTVLTRANVYFDGKVVSHTVLFGDGSRKTLGLIYPGSYRFDTKAAEVMEIVEGACRVSIAGAAEAVTYPAGTCFRIPADSYFDIHVDTGITQYICSFE